MRRYWDLSSDERRKADAQCAEILLYRLIDEKETWLAEYDEMEKGIYTHFVEVRNKARSEGRDKAAKLIREDKWLWGVITSVAMAYADDAYFPDKDDMIVDLCRE